MKAAFRCRRPRSTGSSSRCGCRCPRSPARATPSTHFVDEFAEPGGAIRAVDGPQAARPLHGRRLHGRTLRRGGERAGPRAPSPSSREDAAAVVAAVRDARPRRLHRTPAIRAAWRRWSTTSRSATPSSTSAPTRSSSTSASATRDGHWRTVVDRAEMTRLGEGLEQQGEIIAAALERTVAAIAGHGRRGEAARRARRSPRWARRACGSPPTATTVVAAIQARSGVADRSDLRRGGGPPGLPRGQGRARARATGSLVVFDTGGGSSQFTFGHGLAGGRALQRRRRRRALHRALRARRRRVAARCCARRSAAICGRPVAHRRPPGSRRAGGDGRRGDQHDRGQARARHLRSDCRPGHGPRPRRDRPPDRALPVAGCATRAAPSSACSRSARKSSSPVPASSAR